MPVSNQQVKSAPLNMLMLAQHSASNKKLSRGALLKALRNFFMGGGSLDTGKYWT
jgi:hypothetical protein